MLLSLEQSLLSLFPREHWCDTRVLLAISGGADSVALLRAICRLAESSHLIEAAHMNHGWRGLESDNDQHFVEQLCSEHGIRLHIRRSVAQAGHPISPSATARSEELARHERYRFLADTAYGCGARYVLTAHTASDRVETLLHNLFRGTGLAGVAVPAFSRPLDDELVLVRPLLASYRSDVEAYLAELNQSFRIDSTNFDQGYRRNFLRHTLLPLLRQNYDPQVDTRLLAFSELAEEVVLLIRTQAEDYLEQVSAMQSRAVSATGSNRSGVGAEPLFRDPQSASSALFIPREHMLQAAWPVVVQALQIAWQRRDWSLQAMSREHWQRIRDAWSCSEHDDQSLVVKLNQLPGNLQLRRTADWLVITSNEHLE